MQIKIFIMFFYFFSLTIGKNNYKIVSKVSMNHSKIVGHNNKQKSSRKITQPKKSRVYNSQKNIITNTNPVSKNKSYEINHDNPHNFHKGDLKSSINKLKFNFDIVENHVEQETIVDNSTNFLTISYGGFNNNKEFLKDLLQMSQYYQWDYLSPFISQWIITKEYSTIINSIKSIIFNPINPLKIITNIEKSSLKTHNEKISQLFKDFNNHSQSDSIVNGFHPKNLKFDYSKAVIDNDKINKQNLIDSNAINDSEDNSLKEDSPVIDKIDSNINDSIDQTENKTSENIVNNKNNDLIYCENLLNNPLANVNDKINSIEDNSLKEDSSVMDKIDRNINDSIDQTDNKTSDNIVTNKSNGSIYCENPLNNPLANVNDKINRQNLIDSNAINDSVEDNDPKDKVNNILNHDNLLPSNDNKNINKPNSNLSNHNTNSPSSHNNSLINIEIKNKNSSLSGPTNPISFQPQYQTFLSAIFQNTKFTIDESELEFSFKKLSDTDILRNEYIIKCNEKLIQKEKAITWNYDYKYIFVQSWINDHNIWYLQTKQSLSFKTKTSITLQNNYIFINLNPNYNEKNDLLWNNSGQIHCFLKDCTSINNYLKAIYITGPIGKFSAKLDQSSYLPKSLSQKSFGFIDSILKDNFLLDRVSSIGSFFKINNYYSFALELMATKSNIDFIKKKFVAHIDMKYIINMKGVVHMDNFIKNIAHSFIYVNNGKKPIILFLDIFFKDWIIITEPSNILDKITLNHTMVVENNFCILLNSTEKTIEANGSFNCNIKKISLFNKICNFKISLSTSLHEKIWENIKIEFTLDFDRLKFVIKLENFSELITFLQSISLKFSIKKLNTKQEWYYENNQWQKKDQLKSIKPELKNQISPLNLSL